MTSFQPATESQTGHIGARQTRVEDTVLLRGLGCYADDAAIIRSLHAHARITSVDFSGALLMKGMHGVQVGEDVKRWATAVPGGFAAADGQGFFPYVVMMDLASFA
jgi:2-furoyl-CoA dehydrogenase large subunit